MLHSNTWNYLSVQTNVYKYIFNTYMYEQYLALNSLQVLMCQPTKGENWYFKLYRSDSSVKGIL